MHSIGVPIGGEAMPLLPEPQATLALPAPLAPDHRPQELRTQATYRLLVGSGMPGVDAAAVIGYAVGLGACQSRWTLKEINRLLFLRDLYANSAWGDAERREAR